VETSKNLSNENALLHKRVYKILNQSTWSIGRKWK